MLSAATAVIDPVSTEQYGFTQRLSARYGTHDRIAVTPAEHVNHGERWDGDRLVLWAEGTVRQDIAYGENLASHAATRWMQGRRR